MNRNVFSKVSGHLHPTWKLKLKCGSIRNMNYPESEFHLSLTVHGVSHSSLIF